QRDAEQEPHAGHDAIAIADADAGLGQMQLEAANVVGGGRVRGTLEECRKSLAARDVAALCMGPQLACGHVLDHTPTPGSDGGIGTHGELLLSEAIQGPRSFLRTGLPAPTMVSSRLATNPRSGTPRSGYRGSDLVPWGQSGRRTVCVATYQPKNGSSVAS